MTPDEHAELKRQVANLRAQKQATEAIRDDLREKVELERKVAELKVEIAESEKEIECLRQGKLFRKRDFNDDQDYDGPSDSHPDGWGSD